jgi:hypothetical protein
LGTLGHLPWLGKLHPGDTAVRCGPWACMRMMLYLKLISFFSGLQIRKW